MKKSILSSLAIILTILLLSGCAAIFAEATPTPVPTPTPTTGELSGKVFWTGDNKPAENITVYLNEPMGQGKKDASLETYKCKIDAEGKFSFADVKPGAYMFTIWWIDDNGKPASAQSGYSVKAPGVKSDDSGMTSSFEGTNDKGGWAWATDFGKITINAGDALTQNIEFTKQ